ncbi:MAG TPA: hypothetical protein VG651_11680 [Stellaceae bacterium]|nr:hypothetical protein [Stellaceae bacterium]
MSMWLPLKKKGQVAICRTTFRKTVGQAGEIRTWGARVALLEVAVGEISGELKAIRADLAGLKNVPLDLAEIKGRLTNMPTTVTLLATVVTILAAGFGMALAVAKLSSGH